ncbi:MAG: protoheme IX farnesyltransferase [Phycisphaerales bacterium]|nr:protoheme IX farnesyltransferase [Phycisphaerales bacterium]
MTQLNAEPLAAVQPVERPSPAAVAAIADGVPSLGEAAGGWRSAVELTKPGIVKLVTVTSAVGFALGALQRGWEGWSFIWMAAACIAGTALSAAGANALNQVIERRRDALMHRTRHRPIPGGRIAPLHGLALGTALSVVGVVALGLSLNGAAATVSAVTIVTYLFWYTPLKPHTPLATLVGAIPGALPPLIGWSAASLDPWASIVPIGSWELLLGGWSVFLIMFVWQVPHFLAIAWKYRDDYARGGHMVLPVVDPGGGRTAAAVVMWSWALVAVSFSPVLAMPGRIGVLYAAIAFAAGMGMVWRAHKLARDRTDEAARGLFFASIIYLPVVLLILVTDGAMHRLF